MHQFAFYEESWMRVSIALSYLTIKYKATARFAYLAQLSTKIAKRQKKVQLTFNMLCLIRKCEHAEFWLFAGLYLGQEPSTGWSWSYPFDTVLL